MTRKSGIILISLFFILIAGVSVYATDTGRIIGRCNKCHQTFEFDRYQEYWICPSCGHLNHEMHRLVPVAPTRQKYNIPAYDELTKMTAIIDGKTLVCDPQTVLYNAVALVPARDIAQALGAEISWDSMNQSLDIAKDKQKITLYISSLDVAYCSNVDKYQEGPILPTLKMAPIIINNRAMIPVAYVADNFGCRTVTNFNDMTVTITTNPKPTTAEIENAIDIAKKYSTNTDNYKIQIPGYGHYDYPLTGEWSIVEIDGTISRLFEDSLASDSIIVLHKWYLEDFGAPPYFYDYFMLRNNAVIASDSYEDIK